MLNPEFLKETTAQISQDIFEGQKIISQNYQDLQILLAEKIKQLLSGNINQLLNILYRLDISEHKVKNVFKLLSEEDIADHLAELIIQREFQKIETRIKYSSKNS